MEEKRMPTKAANLTQKQQMELEKKRFEIAKHNSDVYFELFLQKLKIYEIDNEPKEFLTSRHHSLYWIIRELSREKMSVNMVRRLLKLIFVTSDLSADMDSAELDDIILERFSLCTNLAQSCKMNMHELLRNCSKKIYSNITKMLILHGQTLNFISRFIGIEFFKRHILPKAWYHLLKAEDLSPADVQDNIARLKIFDELAFPIKDLQQGLYHCIAKLALQPEDQMKDKEKHAMMTALGNAFGLSKDEMRDLYFSQKKASVGGRTIYFETELLKSIISKLGMSKKFLFENSLEQKDPNRLLVCFSKKIYINSVFFKGGQNREDKQPLRVLEALRFLHSEFKTQGERKETRKTTASISQALAQSDFPVCLMEAFTDIYQKNPSAKLTSNEESKLTPEQKHLYLSEQALAEEACQKQNQFMAFTRMVELIFKHKLCEEQEVLKKALISQVTFVLKKCTEEEGVVEMAIYSLQIVLNSIGIADTIKNLDKFLSIAIHAFLQHSEIKRIKNYTKKIFEFYIKDKQSYSQDTFKNLQFVFLHKVNSSQIMKDAIQIIHNELYCTEQKIKQNLTHMVNRLKGSSEIIRVLCTRYILELLESKSHENTVRKVLVQPKVLKNVYFKILAISHDFTSDLKFEFSVLCGKVIAAIGLQHSFVNDTVNLKAKNQKTLTRDSDDGSRPKDVNVNSDFYNPVTNAGAYEKEKDKHDSTIEKLALPILYDIGIERDKCTTLATQVRAKMEELTDITDDHPKNYFYTLFMLEKYQKEKKAEGEMSKKKKREHAPIEKDAAGLLADDLQTTIHRYVKLGKAEVDHTQIVKNYRQILPKLSLYLIDQIEDKSWANIFKACLPAIKQNTEIMYTLLPYLVYYALRFNWNNDRLVNNLGEVLNHVLRQQHNESINQVLKVLDFLNIAHEQEKHLFKEFIEDHTKFRYVEKLFHLDISQTSNDDNIKSFIRQLREAPIVKSTFLLVKKLNKLKTLIDKDAKNQGAKRIGNYKRCIFNTEEIYRQQSVGTGKTFLDILPADQTIELVKMCQRINPEDFQSDLFTNIVKAEGLQQPGTSAPLKVRSRQETKADRDFENRLGERHIISRLKERKWDELLAWLGDFDLNEITLDQLMFSLDEENGSQESFWMVLCFIFAEYHKGLQAMLRSDKPMEDSQYLSSLKKIQNFLRLLYQYFMLYLCDQGSYHLKLFLHVVYEIDSAIFYLKDILFSQKEAITELICRDVNKKNRKFERIYYDLDMKLPFEYLLTWFEERSNSAISDNEALMLVFQVRKLFFSLFERENEEAVYLMKIAKLERKMSNDMIFVNKLFKECEGSKSRIINFEYEYAKFILKFKNAHDSYQYLSKNSEAIKAKCEHMQKDHVWMPQRVYHKVVLLSMELQIKIDARNPQILPLYTKFVKDLSRVGWEKPNFKYAQYLDLLDTPACGITQQQTMAMSDEDKKKRIIQKIFYYIKSLENGHKYIWQSLPRALHLWFDYKDDVQDDSRIQMFMRQELAKLDNFKLATALPILLSRYSHPNSKVRETIHFVLSKLSCAYPGQSAWWIFHYLYFDDSAKKQKKEASRTVTRAEFAKELLNKIVTLNKEVSKQILEGEKIFFELKKLGERQPSKAQDTEMDMPQTLQRITKSHLVMPIEENLQVQLPPKHWNQNTSLSALVSTLGDVTEHNALNAEIDDFLNRTTGAQPAETHKPEFSAFKEEPVMLSSFLPKVTVMHSKEKPKKIGIIGSDGQSYNFLLKCDKYGDLRKEQRFIDFASLCNKMMANDAEARKRNLSLRTFAIVPLSRCTGLIEWVQSTQTLKSIVSESWKKNNIKGEMSDIKKRAQDQKQGDTHTGIWNDLRKDMKPALGNYFSEHFHTPDIWYEAKINFIRSTAIWSMIGYIIGLGDRHGDNILIHNHTGEVTHVDFDCIFEKGAKLRVPEIVPFRMTSNIVDALGVFQEKGVFQTTCEIVLRVLRKNSNNIGSFMQQFKHDPLSEANNNVKVEIDSGLKTVEYKLNGHMSEAQASATVEEQVDQVILNAINDESLKQMYIGWMPWL